MIDTDRSALRQAIREWRTAATTLAPDLTASLVAGAIALVAEVITEIDPGADLYVTLPDLADRVALTDARTDAAVAALETAGWLEVEADHAGYRLTLRQAKESHR